MADAKNAETIGERMKISEPMMQPALVWSRCCANARRHSSAARSTVPTVSAAADTVVPMRKGNLSIQMNRENEILSRRAGANVLEDELRAGDDHTSASFLVATPAECKH